MKIHERWQAADAKNDEETSFARTDPRELWYVKLSQIEQNSYDEKCLVLPSIKLFSNSLSLSYMPDRKRVCILVTH